MKWTLVTARHSRAMHIRAIGIGEVSDTLDSAKIRSHTSELLESSILCQKCSDQVHGVSMYGYTAQGYF